MHGLLLGWWALIAVPVVTTTVRERWDAFDRGARALLTSLVGAVAVLAAAGFGDLRADGVGVALALLAAAHLAAAAVAARSTRRDEGSTGPALFLLCLAGIAGAGAVVILVGGPLRPVLWAAEWALYLWIARRYDDRWAAGTAAALAVLAVGSAAWLAPPSELWRGADDALAAGLAWGAVALGAVWTVLRVGRRALCDGAFAGDGAAALAAIGIPLVAWLSPGAGPGAPADPVAQSAQSLLWLAAVLGLALAAPRLGERAPVAWVVAGTLALLAGTKAALVDGLLYVRLARPDGEDEDVEAPAAA